MLWNLFGAFCAWNWNLMRIEKSFFVWFDVYFGIGDFYFKKVTVSLSYFYTELSVELSARTLFLKINRLY